MPVSGPGRRPMTGSGSPNSNARSASCAGQTRSSSRHRLLRGGARPPVPALIAYIDQDRERFEVEPICRVLTEAGAKIAPSTYYVHHSRPPSARAVADERLKTEIGRVHRANLGVYGVRKVWRQLTREGVVI